VGDSIGEARLREPAGDFIGGAAIVLRKIDPPVSLAEIEERLRQFRAKPDYAEIEARNTRVLLIDGSPERATSAVIVVHDPKVSYLDNRQVWQDEVRDREWGLAKAALTQASTLSSVESFSPSVAASFRNAAIAAILLSTVMVVIYVWVRFNSFRYSAAAIITTLHDCLVAIGLVAIASVVYEKLPGVAGALGILPFKIDLNMVAAILTILGYSLNDTVIVMDRIRENRGKLPYASRKCVNDSINQTISRTIITSGTTFIATLILYIFGGEGVREFAYTMLCGIMVGTFSSIAVSAPLVWVRAVDPHADETVPAGVPAKA
jgi:SecD/SecF fusion protein